MRNLSSVILSFLLVFSLPVGEAASSEHRPRNMLDLFGVAWSYLTKSEPEGVGQAQQGDGVLKDPDETAKDMPERFKLLPGSKFIQETNIPVGYLRLYFTAVDNDGTVHSLTDPQTKGLFDRTIVDWAKSLLATKNREYLVTLDILDGAERVIATQPVFHFRYQSGFSYQGEFLSQNTNGYIGYPVISNESMKVRLTVRYSDDVNASQTVNALVTAANSALTAGVVPVPVTSVFKAFQVPAVNTQVADLQTKLGQFKEIKKISRTAELSYQKQDNKYLGFVYHFRAPTRPAADTIKLKVNLEYKNSLLTTGAGGALNTRLANVGAQKIHQSESNFLRLVEYVKANSLFQERWQGLSNAKMVSICDAIRGSFRGKLTAMDASLGMEAFLFAESGNVGPHWDPKCYKKDDLDALKRLRPGEPTTFEAPNLSDATPTAVSFARQIKGFLDAARVLLLASNDDMASAVAADAISSRRNQITAKLNGGNVQMTGMPEFFGATYPNEAYNSGWLSHALLSTSSGKTGCYWRNAHSTSEEPNIGTMLSEKSGKIFAHKITFEKTKTQGVSIRPLKWDIFEAPAELLTKYAKKFPAGCPTSKWKPWAGV